MKQFTKRILSGVLALGIVMAQLPMIPTFATENSELEAIKAQLPYTGDISKMNMSAEQAIAMAVEMESLGQEGLDCYVALYDDGTRVPALGLIASNDSENGGLTKVEEYYDDYFGEIRYSYNHSTDFHIWNENLGSLVEFDYWEYHGATHIQVKDDETLVLGEFFPYELVTQFFPTYTLNGGQIELLSYSLFISHYNYTVGTFQEEVDRAKEEYGISHLSIDENHIHFVNGDIAAVWIENGSSVPYDEYYDVFEGFESNLNIGLSGPPATATGNWAKASTVAPLLREYAELSQFRFKFPEFSTDSNITDLFSSLNLPGTMLECYEVAQDFYYVIMEENGVETGYLICAVKENGQVVYKIVHESTEILPEDTLSTEGNSYTFDSNIEIQFEEVKDFQTQEDYVGYFTNALRNITGTSLNDQGKSELALSMQDSIVNFATFVLNLGSGTGEIKEAEVAPLVEKSNGLYQDFVTLLREEQAELNKDLEQTVRVVLQGLDEENWTIYLNPDLIGQLEGNNLQVFLSSGQQGIEVSAEDLEALLTAHDGLFVNVQKTGTDQYAISFADNAGNTIEKLENPVKIFLLTNNEFATVMLDYAQGTENWGGQFNASTNTIQFSTIHNGTYLIMDNSVEIHDVSEDYLSMVQFMVSKGFFEVDENGNFNPTGNMDRNDFTKTIVSMFFALDHDLKSSFPDVLEDSPYYSYIASGESKDIVAGYDDGLFHGEAILTEEMAFALIAQTLVDKKGYTYPEDLDFYLNSVTGADLGNDWAKRGIALSVRDSIVLPEESVNPTGDISRQDAAVYLYRLFMLLEEKQQINFELVEEITLEGEEIGEETEENSENSQGMNPIVYIAGGAALGAVAVGGGILYKKRKV